jgi:membrane associated rhomboid family serine protease
MSEPFATCTVAIIVLTSCFSLIGFRDFSFREKYLFSATEILAGKQYYRAITSALLHADWQHLLLNMVSLYLFGRHIELFLGPGRFLLIYFAAIVGGSALSLIIHRHHEYRAYGASGGVCGMIFSYIFLFPGGSIVSFQLPVPMPSWLFAILFFVGSFLALRRQDDNIGHDAHLGGAIIGLWTSAALEPWMVRQQPKLFVTISVLSVLLFWYLARNPLFLPLTQFLPAWAQRQAKSGPGLRSRSETLELDGLLEKISKSGIDSLSPEEKAALNSISEKYRRRSESKKPESDLII